MPLESPSSQEQESISFYVLGDQYNLRCSKAEKPYLLKAIKEVQNKAAALLRAHPTLTAKQAAVLCAVDINSRLLTLTDGNSPFVIEAQSLMRSIRKNLELTKYHD